MDPKEELLSDADEEEQDDNINEDDEDDNNEAHASNAKETDCGGNSIHPHHQKLEQSVLTNNGGMFVYIYNIF